jgi:hypothetical protein
MSEVVSLEKQGFVHGLRERVQEAIVGAWLGTGDTMAPFSSTAGTRIERKKQNHENNEALGCADDVESRCGARADRLECTVSGASCDR